MSKKRICDNCQHFYEAEGQTKEVCDAVIIRGLFEGYANQRMNGNMRKCEEFESWHKKVDWWAFICSLGALVLSVLGLISMLLAYVVVKPIYVAAKCLKWAVLAILSIGKWTLIILAAIIAGGVIAFLIANALYNIL